MLDQPGRAIGAFEAMAATPAERERRVAAPVQEQHRLLAPCPRFFDGGDCARRQPPAARRTFALEVDQGDVGQPRRAEASGKSEPAVASALGVEPRLDRRRRGGEHDRRLLESRTHDRHVARVVDDAFLLLVGALVLLVDHDEAEVGERQKERRARADNHGRLAARDRRPDAFALALRQAGVPFGGPARRSARRSDREIARSAQSPAGAQAPGAFVATLRRPPRNKPRSCPIPSRPQAGSSRTRARRRGG